MSMLPNAPLVVLVMYKESAVVYPWWLCTSLVMFDAILIVVLCSLLYLTGVLVVAEPKPKNETFWFEIWRTFFSKSMVQFYMVVGGFSIIIYFLSKHIADTCL